MSGVYIARGRKSDRIAPHRSNSSLQREEEPLHQNSTGAQRRGCRGWLGRFPVAAHAIGSATNVAGCRSFQLYDRAPLRFGRGRAFFASISSLSNSPATIPCRSTSPNRLLVIVACAYVWTSSFASSGPKSQARPYRAGQQLRSAELRRSSHCP